MISKAFFCAKTTYTDWLISSRLLVFGYIFIFVYVYFIKPMNELTYKLATPINALEPFVAIANNRYTLPLIVIGFMVLISDFPRLNDFATFSLFRTGRISWLIGQIIFLTMAGLTYIGFILIITMVLVMNNAFCVNAWSLVQKEMNMQTEQSLLMQRLYPFAQIDNSVLRQSRPIEAVLHGAILIFLFIIIVGCVQLFFALRQQKIISVFINLLASASGLILLMVDIKVKWLFPISNAVFGWHYDGTYNITIIPIWWSYVYFISLFIILIILLYRLTRKCSFHITGGTE